MQACEIACTRAPSDGIAGDGDGAAREDGDEPARPLRRFCMGTRRPRGALRCVLWTAACARLHRPWVGPARDLSFFFFPAPSFFQKAVAENGAPTNKSSPSARDSTETIFKQADVWPPDPADAQRRQCRNHVIKSVMTLIGSLIRLLVVYWCARAAWEQPGSRHTTPRHPWNGTEWRWVFGPLSHKTYNPSI